jgi:hypothetical protein
MPTLDLPSLVMSPPVPRFDPTCAAALAQTLLGLADALDRATAIEASRYPSTIADWAGFTRRWFEHQHHGIVAELRVAAASAREEAAWVVAAPMVGP